MNKYFLIFTLALSLVACKKNATPDETFGVKSTPNININLLAITPNQKNLSFGEIYQFQAIGGTEPYVFELESGVGSISESGQYIAPNYKGSAVIQVADARGKIALATIQVVEKLTVSPGSKIIGTTQSASFVVSGGVSPYTFEVISGAGTIGLSTGVYTAPSFKTNVIIEITDAFGATAYASVVVSDELNLLPTSVILGYAEEYTFTASGGTPPYTYSVEGSIGSITSSGVFTAPSSDATITVRVVDNNGNAATSSVTVQNKPKFSKDQIILPISGEYTPTVTSGSPPYSFSITGGGSILDGVTGKFQAPTILQTSSLRVTDSAGYYDDLIFTTFRPRQISGGDSNTCVTSFDSSGGSSIKCFGNGISSGQGVGYTGNDPNEMGDNLSSPNLGDLYEEGTFIPTTVIGVFAKHYNTCAVLSDYRVKCWGHYNYGAHGFPGYQIGLERGSMGSNLQYINLGTGRRINSTLPLDEAFTFGYYGGCAILDNDTMKCWGLNTYGEVGIGTASNIGDGTGEMGDNLPAIQLGAGAAVPVQVSRGEQHVCVRVSDGRVKCWGYNNYGQLGQGDTTTRGHTAGTTPDNFGFIDLGIGVTAKYIASGNNFNCVITNTDKVKCWGYNGHGELGQEHTLPMGDGAGEMGDNLPFVDLGTGYVPVKLTAGTYHVCALMASGVTKCWGYNGTGQFAIGDATSRGSAAGQMGDSLPVSDWGSGTVLDVDAGYYSTCVQIDLDSDAVADIAKCVGRNDSGQLGLGHAFDMGTSGLSIGANLPAIELGTGLKPKDISISQYHACALLDNNALKCWGANVHGSTGLEDAYIGDFTDEVKNHSSLTLAEGIISSKSFDSTTCILTGNAELKCFGLNTYGGVGLGHTLQVGLQASDFANLQSIEFGSGVNVNDYAVGHYSTCALLSNNGLKCWGYNGYGQLGQGHVTTLGNSVATIPASIPDIDLGTGLYAVKIAAGYYHYCALLNNGKVKCWGNNNYGVLGQGDTDRRGDAAGEMGDNLPHVILDTADARTVTDLCGGYEHSCAILDNGKVKCWGHYQRLGAGYDPVALSFGDEPGEMGDNLSYVNLGTGRTAKKISCAAYHNCAILDNNDLKCWGIGTYGVLGIGSSAHKYAVEDMGDALPAVNLGQGKYAIEVYLGNRHSCAVLNDNSVKCWGRNDSAQLGLGHLIHMGDSSISLGDNLPAIDLGVP